MSQFAIVIVRGSGDVGSAVAHALFMRGVNVVLHDEPMPSHPRRGMAFADALFDGQSVLSGIQARRVLDLEEILNVGALSDELPVTDAPFTALLALYEPDVLVDARMRKRSIPEDQRLLAPTTIGLGPGFDTNRNCHIAIETSWGEALGRVVRNGATNALAGGPKLLDGVGRERFVYAARDALWQTDRHVGERVVKNQLLGRLDGEDVVAPLGGVLRGISRSGVPVSAGRKIIEVDPREVGQIAGLGERPKEIAQGVLQALNVRPEPATQFFVFEREFERALDCMPMSVRMKMDLCGLKLSLAQWRRLSLDARRVILNAPNSTALQVRRLTRFIQLSMSAAGERESLPIVAVNDECWRSEAGIPAQVFAAVRAAGLPHLSELAWKHLTDLQRFALVKLTAKTTGSRNLRPALQEFGLV